MVSIAHSGGRWLWTYVQLRRRTRVCECSRCPSESQFTWTWSPYPHAACARLYGESCRKRLRRCRPQLFGRRSHSPESLLRSSRMSNLWIALLTSAFGSLLSPAADCRRWEFYFDFLAANLSSDRLWCVVEAAQRLRFWLLQRYRKRAFDVHHYFRTMISVANAENFESHCSDGVLKDGLIRE